MNKAPASHEWEIVKTGLWRCPWCDGYFRSEKKPDPEAVANSLAAADPEHSAALSGKSKEE
jgi:hypothetical protein